MSYVGLSFDGLDHNKIDTSGDVITTGQNIAAHFIATDASLQYRANASNVDIQSTTTLTPQFSFKNNQGVILNSTVNTGILESNQSNIITTAGNVPTLLTVSGFSDPSNTLVRVTRNSSSDGTGAEITNTSASNPVMIERNNSSNTIVPIQQSFAPNLPEGGNTSILIGKNTSSNSNSFYLKYNHESVEDNRHFSIQPHGSTDSIDVYKPNIGASATTSTVQINGGLKATTTYSGSPSWAASVATIEGLTANEDFSLWNLVNYSNGSNRNPMRIMQPNLPVSNQTFLRLGKAVTSGNCVRLIYRHQSENNSSNNNQFIVELEGGGYALQVQKANITAGAGADAYTAQVNGGLKATTTYYGSPSWAASVSTIEGLTANSDFSLWNLINYSNGNDRNPMRIMQPNLPVNNQTFLRFGKAVTSGNCVRLIYRHRSENNASNNNQFIVEMEGGGYALQVQKASITSGPGADDYTVQVSGGLKAQNTYITGVASNTSLKLLQNNTTTTGLTLSASSASTNYSLIFPSNQGAVNQFLQLSNTTTGQLQWVNGTGTGGGGTGVTSVALTPTGAISSIFTGSAAQTGPNVVLNLSTASTPTGSGTTLVLSQAPTFTGTTVFSGPITGSIGSVFGDSGTVISTNPILKLEGDSNNSVLRQVLQLVDHTDEGSSVPLQSFSPNLALGQYSAIRFGKNSTQFNSGRLNFNYVANQSTTNYISLTLAAQTESVQIYSPDIASDIDTGTLVVNGGLFADNIHTSDVDTQTLTTGSIVVENGANTMGSIFTLATNSLPILKIEGDSNGSSTNICNIIDYSNTGFVEPLSILRPSCPEGFHTAIRLGKELSILNSVRLNYNHVGDGNNANNFSVALHGQSDSIKISKPDITSAVDTGTLVVNGGLYADDAVVNDKATIGTTSTSNASNPTLLVQGTSVNSGLSPLRVTNNNSSNSNGLITGLAPNLAVNQSTFITLGKELTTGNAGQIAFTNRNNIDTNEIAITHFNRSPSVLIKKDSVSDTLTVNGGITATGAITASGGISANSITFTGSSGTQTDLSLWWAFHSTDPATNVLQYPFMPYEGNPSLSGAIPNRQYCWQQVGKQYSFSFNFYCTIQNTTNQLHLVFLRMASHDPPTPFTGDYTMKLTNDYGTSPAYESTVQFGSGLYIPAM